MMLRIIHGKLKPGTWDSYERAYKDVVAKAGKIPGLKGRWLAHADDDPDAGYTISLRENDTAMRTYESGEVLQNTSAAAEAVFLWRLHHYSLRSAVWEEFD
jgi:heme-degrading monooxygenase HmoA